MPSLKNPKHEAFCREVAGGLSYDQAWVATGHSAASNNVGRLVRRQEIIRVVSGALAGLIVVLAPFHPRGPF